MAVKTPHLSVDGIIELYKEGDFEGIVLIERLNEPLGLAIPGGFTKETSLRERYHLFC